MTEPMEFRAALTAWKTDHGLTTLELAQLGGITAATVRYWECDLRSRGPSIETLVRLEQGRPGLVSRLFPMAFETSEADDATDIAAEG